MMNRIFHPVGQGAFYSEHFKGFTVVYDCGSASTSLTKRQLETKINSSFYEKQEIDLLFISHFHADHVNGLDYLKKRCRIKRVVIPHLDNDAKTLLMVENAILKGYNIAPLLDDTETFFGADVIRVLPFDEELETVEIATADDNNITGVVFSGFDESNHTIPSGRPITIVQTKWLYVPYNYMNQDRLTIFKKAIADLGLDFQKLKSIDYIKTHQKKLIAAYKTVGNLNLNSLVVYSGHHAKFLTGKDIPKAELRFCKFLPHYYSIGASCLYTADADLNQAGQSAYLERSLLPVLPYIATIQVPHHGAIKNHNATFFEKFSHDTCFVISYGTTNSYGHPSDMVISDIKYLNGHVARVTEETESLFSLAIKTYK